MPAQLELLIVQASSGLFHHLPYYTCFGLGFLWQLLKQKQKHPDLTFATLIFLLPSFYFLTGLATVGLFSLGLTERFFSPQENRTWLGVAFAFTGPEVLPALIQRLLSQMTTADTSAAKGIFDCFAILLNFLTQSSDEALALYKTRIAEDVGRAYESVASMADQCRKDIQDRRRLFTSDHWTKQRGAVTEIENSNTLSESEKKQALGDFMLSLVREKVVLQRIPRRFPTWVPVFLNPRS